MVSITRAFYRVMAAVASSFTDSTTTHQEVPKLSKGSIDHKNDAVFELNPVQAEMNEYSGGSLCTTKKKKAPL